MTNDPNPKEIQSLKDFKRPMSKRSDSSRKPLKKVRTKRYLLQRDAVEAGRRIGRGRIGEDDSVGVCDVDGDGRPVHEIGRSKDHVSKSLRPRELERESVGTK